MVQVGDQAPDFTLPSSNRDQVTLSEVLKERIAVLAFYHFAFTDGCGSMLVQLQEEIDDFHRLGAEVYGISADSHFAQWWWAHERELDYPLLGDLDRKTFAPYGVEMPELAGYSRIAQRAIFVVGRDGKIAYADVGQEHYDQPEALPALEAVRKLAEAS